MSKNVLVYGGKGALGTVVLDTFKKAGWWTCSVDMRANDAADANVLVANDPNWSAQFKAVCTDVEKALANRKLNAVFCVAGGFGMGKISNPDIVESCDLMWKQSVWSSLIASHVMSKYGAPSSLLVLTGAVPALADTPAMIGYGMAKAAVHQLVKSLSAKSSGLPEKTVALGILPVTLDTPANRSAMPKADMSKWTTLQFVANTMNEWANGENVPHNGSLVQFHTSAGKTELVLTSGSSYE